MALRKSSGNDSLSISSSAHNREGGDRQRIIIGTNFPSRCGPRSRFEIENRLEFKAVNFEFFFAGGVDDGVSEPDAERVLHRGVINKLILTPILWNVRSGNKLLERVREMVDLRISHF